MRGAGERAARARLLAAGLVLAASTLMPAVAGDGSALTILGFSPDGTRFAIEQSGFGDASIEPYARITVAGAGGGEIERRIAEEHAPIERARAEAREAAKALLDGVHAPALLLDSHPEARASDELLPMEVRGVANAAETQLVLDHPALHGRARVVLSERPVPGGICEPMTSEAVRYTVTLERADGSTRILGEGPADPRARMCPRRHGLVAAYLHDNAGARALGIVVQEFPLGFEGPDRRFFAIHAPLAD